ncbi:hypothetical protein [Candidatus Poriferisodalis sp.]|uniref:hypothetical protein n=1 Tax=Candidatus Poriferisodalis sp. TaxID=3101277 RepID=UPI003B01D7DB
MAAAAALLALGSVAVSVSLSNDDAGAHPGYFANCRVVGQEWVVVNGSYLDHWRDIVVCDYIHTPHSCPSWLAQWVCDLWYDLAASA